MATGKGSILGLVLAAALGWAATGRAAWIFDGKPSSWEGTQEELKADERVFPALLLRLGGNWTDFELKASTDNFSKTLVYYVRSSSASPRAGDPDVRVYFTDDYSGNVLRWRLAEPMTAIGEQLADPVHSEVEYVLVMPSHECAVHWRTWMSRDNNRLVWSYVRFDGIDYERNADGTKTRWNVAVPVQWRKGRIAP